MRDIAGLYMHPPTHAVVFCVDEKSQIQAMHRTQPVLPMRPGQVERRTHDYRRHGTTTLFAALNVKTSALITQSINGIGRPSLASFWTRSTRRSLGTSTCI